MTIVPAPRGLPRARSLRGFTLLEALLSLVLVGMVVVAALSALGSALAIEQLVAERGHGLGICRQLMAEILRQPYADPDGGPLVLGPDASEVGDGSRALWDDVDDYDGWSASPPQDKDGTVAGNRAGWTRIVAVVWVDPTDPSQTVGSDQGAKWISVTVTRDGKLITSLAALRSSAAPGSSG